MANLGIYAIFSSLQVISMGKAAIENCELLGGKDVNGFILSLGSFELL